MSLRAEAEAILHDRSKVIDAEREQLRRFAAAYIELLSKSESQDSPKAEQTHRE